MRKLILLSIISLLAVVGAWAQGNSTAPAEAVVIDGIRYELNSATNTATVVSAPNGSRDEGYYSGDIVIPKNVRHDGTDYTVTEIGNSAFESQFEIVSVDIPSTVNKLGMQALYKNINLKSITCRAIIPPATSTGVESIDYSICYDVPLYVPAESLDAYKSADMWKEFRTILSIGTITAEVNGLWYFLNPDHTATVIPSQNGMYQGEIVVPSMVNYDNTDYTVTAVGNGAFIEKDSAITSITLPETIKSIGESTFTAYYYSEETPMSLTIYAETPPATVDTEDNPYATFQEPWTVFGTLYVPESAVASYKEKLPWKLFRNIEAIPVTPQEPVWVIADGIRYQLSELSDGTPVATAVSAEEAKEVMHVRASVTDENTGTEHTVIALGNWVFSQRTGITTIMLPATIQTIGEGAFYGISTLASIYCDAVTPPSVKIADNESGVYGSFDEHCINNVSFVVPGKSVESIYREAEPWKSFKNLSYRWAQNDISYRPNEDNGTVEVTSNPNATYEGDVVIDSKVTDEEGNEYTVTAIGDYAFAGQIGMNSVTIPETMESLGSAVFEGCTGLTKIVCESATPPTAIHAATESQAIRYRAVSHDDIVPTFDDWCFDNVELDVPQGSLAAYKSVEPWCNFKVIKDNVNTGINFTPSDATGIQINGDKLYPNGKYVRVYDMTGRIIYGGNKTVVLQPGLYVIKVDGQTIKVRM